MKHGPIALIDSTNGHEKTTVVFLFILNNDTFAVLTNCLDQMHSRNAYVVVITDCIEKLQENFQKELHKYKAWKEQLEKEFEVKTEELKDNPEELAKYKEAYLR